MYSRISGIVLSQKSVNQSRMAQPTNNQKHQNYMIHAMLFFCVKWWINLYKQFTFIEIQCSDVFRPRWEDRYLSHHCLNTNSQRFRKNAEFTWDLLPKMHQTWFLVFQYFITFDCFFLALSPKFGLFLWGIPSKKSSHWKSQP